MNQSPEKEKGMSFIKKAGKWAPLVGGAWIVLNIVVPLAPVSYTHLTLPTKA